MRQSTRRTGGAWIWLVIAAGMLAAGSCTRTPPPAKDYTVGIADRVEFAGESLVLHHFRLFSDGFLVSTTLPPDAELKGKVLLQIEGLKLATKISAELGKGLQLAGAPHDSAQAKAFRERIVDLEGDLYTLTEFPGEGEPRDIPTVDIKMIVLEQ